MTDVPLPPGVTIEPFDPEQDIAPEGSPTDCDGGNAPDEDDG